MEKKHMRDIQKIYKRYTKDIKRDIHKDIQKRDIEEKYIFI